MPSFDVSSSRLARLDNAINKPIKKLRNGTTSKAQDKQPDTKAKTVALVRKGKMDALNDIFQNKAIKRGCPLSFDYKTRVGLWWSCASYQHQAGVSKEGQRNYR